MANEQMALSPQTAIDDIIIIEQLPIIREQLELLREQIQTDVAFALSLSCTEATVKDVKAVRARLSKDFNDLEVKRKEVKKRILAPYEAFEGIYKECVTEVYSPADTALRDKVAEVENGLKEARRIEVSAYFAEYCLSRGIDFLTFERSGVVINLTASKKALKEQVNAIVDKVAADIEFISAQEHEAEILTEYKISLNAIAAINTVTARHKAIGAEQERILRMNEATAEREQRAAKIAQVVDYIKDQEAEAEKFHAPVAAPAPAASENDAQATDAQDKVLTTRFTVRGTRAQLIALKQFLVEGGYDYE
jgi:hypothetical protein